MGEVEQRGISRRDFLRVAGTLGVSGGILGATRDGRWGRTAGTTGGGDHGVGHGSHGGNSTVGDVDTSRFDPSRILEGVLLGRGAAGGREDRPRVRVDGRGGRDRGGAGGDVPGVGVQRAGAGPDLAGHGGGSAAGSLQEPGTPTRTRSTSTASTRPTWTGSSSSSGPGEEFVYEFDAEPFGCHLYHCHTSPLRKHIEKGLYGAFVIDPREGRPEADEMVMVMNGFDTNFDAANEVYAVNTVAFHYQKIP